MKQVPVISSTVNDQPSFTPIHRGTETEISTDIATSSDVDTLLPMVLSSWHARRTLCALSPRDSTVSTWENNFEVVVILNVSKMSISRQDTHVKLFSSSSSKE